jgi:hypothetical protein
MITPEIEQFHGGSLDERTMIRRVALPDDAFPSGKS